MRNTSANFRNDAFINIGNGYFSKRRGKRTMASHCSPILPERKPNHKNYKQLANYQYFTFTFIQFSKRRICILLRFANTVLVEYTTPHVQHFDIQRNSKLSNRHLF